MIAHPPASIDPLAAAREPISLHIAEANPAWNLILQSGAGIACTVGIPFAALLRDELGLSEAQLKPVDALFLDGMPVDTPESTVVPDGARLALAAGLPGIAGLAMKKGSAVRALRSGITHASGETTAPRPGRISLSLYSLVLPLLADHFLQRGVMVEAAQILRYARFAPNDRCRIENTIVSARDLGQVFAKAGEAPFVLLTIGA